MQDFQHSELWRHLHHDTLDTPNTFIYLEHRKSQLFIPKTVIQQLLKIKTLLKYPGIVCVGVACLIWIEIFRHLDFKGMPATFNLLVERSPNQVAYLLMQLQTEHSTCEWILTWIQHVRSEFSKQLVNAHSTAHLPVRPKFLSSHGNSHEEQFSLILGISALLRHKWIPIAE